MASPSSQDQAQITQMQEFILGEAKDRAEEITTKALQDFQIEKTKHLNTIKEKIVQDYERKAKQVETQHAIARSSAINKSRLEKIKARQETIGKISEDTKVYLTNALASEQTSKSFVTKLIVQGLLMLLEDNVEVRCRACDDALVKGCLKDAAAEYAKIIKAETGAAKAVALTLDTVTKLPPAPIAGQHGASCLGGVVLACAGGKITIDNTIDSRLALVLEQAKPTIRGLLFGK